MLGFVQLLANGIVVGSIFALGAVGISLVFGPLRIVNFAQGDYLTFGVYAAVLVNLTWKENIVWATLFALVATAALGVVLDLILWRPMRRRGAKTMSLFVTSIGLAFVLRSLILFVGSSDQRAFRVDVFQVYSFHGLRLSQSQVIAVAIALFAIITTAVVLAQTPFGRSVRALADNVELSAIAGIDVDRLTIYIWILVGGLAGVCGVLAALVQSAFDPNLGFFLLLPLFAAVVLGGIGNAYGALLGGLALGIIEELSTWSGFAGGVNPIWKPVIAFVVLIGVLLLRPQGILGRSRII